MPTLLTQAEFARQNGYSKPYVTKLKAEGRLVMVDGKVDAEASKALIASTADPRYGENGGRRDGGEDEVVGKVKNDSVQSLKLEGLQLENESKRIKLDREKAELLPRADVVAALNDIATQARLMLDELRYRAAGYLVGKNQLEIEQILGEHQAVIMHEIQQQATAALHDLSVPQK